jgi:hypothetical protein
MYSVLSVVVVVELGIEGASHTTTAWLALGRKPNRSDSAFS